MSEQPNTKNSGPAAEQGRGTAGPDQPAGQWTDEDVAAHTPAEVLKAMEAGLLVDLGFPAPRVRR
jgi:hypothetical protein